MELFTRITRALGISICLLACSAFGAFVPGSLDTNYVSVAPGNGWLVGWTNGPVWTRNAGALTNVSQLWTNDTGSGVPVLEIVPPIDRVQITVTNFVKVDQYGHTAFTTISAAGLTFGDSPDGSIIDMYGYLRGTDDAVGFFEMNLDTTLYGGTVAIDPANDNGLPQPFLFSTSYSNNIAAGSPMFAVANSHTNGFVINGNGDTTISGVVSVLGGGSGSTFLGKSQFSSDMNISAHVHTTGTVTNDQNIYFATNAVTANNIDASFPIQITNCTANPTISGITHIPNNNYGWWTVLYILANGADRTVSVTIPNTHVSPVDTYVATNGSFAILSLGGVGGVVTGAVFRAFP